MNRLLVALATSVIFSGCSAERTVNTDSPQKYKSSIEKIKEDLSPEEMEDLQSALSGMVLGQLDPSGEGNFFALAAAANMSDEQLLALVGDEVSGKTAKQIIMESLKERADQAKNQIESGEKHIAEMEQQKVSVSQILDKILISKSQFYWQANSFLEEPVIAFTIQNGSEVPVRRIFVHGILETPGRSVPWVEDDFNYEFSGGLEPGETQNLNLSPNMFGEWGNKSTKGRKDLVLNLQLVGIEAPDETRIEMPTEDNFSDLEKALDSTRVNLEKLEQKLTHYQ